VPTVSIQPEFYYALFRAGLPASLDKARELINRSHNTLRTATELTNTGNASRLEGILPQTGRNVASLASEQVTQLGRNLVPGGVSQAAGWVEETLEEIEEQPVTLGELAQQGKVIAGAASASVAAATQAEGTAAGVSAVRAFFGTAVELLESIGSRLTSPMLIIIPTSTLQRSPIEA
jgi:hypothetical protein